ncbi:nucleoporin NUP188 homolog isoform X2 [Monomorium pharaonis]|uniref:nucleoporin NUP188 homolog isoform X2 n=1 Tax=Monomorium pharaonis TaxID=307658 RepID=UPI00174763AC|nr:nucleoporin NUP188 homolog isoform X2 [Monomorium pharaonis]
MEVAPMGNLSKELWSIISSTTCCCAKETVEEEIKNSTVLLKEGLQFFKPYTDASLQSISKRDPPPLQQMYDLISKLAPLLNLDATITWDLVCNFVSYEYRNCAETFASQLSDLTSTRALIDDIWNFYYSERITLIKCLKLMIEYKDNKRHPHHKEFTEFFNEVLMGNLLESVRKQIEALKFINSPTRSQFCTEDHLHRLYNSTLIEMRELLHILTVIIHDVHIPSNEFAKLYGSIGGEPRRLVSTKSHEDKEAITKKLEEIQYSQTALLLVTLDIDKHTGMEDWINGVRNDMQEIFEHKCVRENLTQDGPLLLSWMLANYAIDPDNMDTLNRFKPFGIKAIQLDVFQYLRDLINCEMFQEETHYAEVVQSSIYNLLSLVCVFVDEDRLNALTGIFDALAAIVKFPECAAKFWDEPCDSIRTIYKVAKEVYPYKFEPLTNIAIGLASTTITSAKKIASELDNLQTVTIEIPRQRDYNKPLQPYEVDCIIHKNSFTIPSNCVRENITVLSNEKEVVLFRTKASYWDALHHKIEQLFSQASGGIMNVSAVKTDLPENVCQGLKLLEALLTQDIEIPSSMVAPTELSLEIINRFSYPVLPTNLYRIVAVCISISSKLVLRYPEDIISRMRSGVYPKFNNWDQKPLDFAEAISFDSGLIASWLSGIETIEHTYPILRAFLDTLYNYLIAKHSKEAMYTIEIPGMVFLLQAVLPKLDSWYFESNTERIDLWLKSMFCIHRALDSALPKNDIRNELQLVVVYSLLYLEPRHALLKLLRTGERTLHNKMITETNWINGKGFKVIKSVELALSIVNRLLMFRKSLGLELSDRSPLEIALYSSPRVPNGLLIVPTIVNYLYVWFSPSLQKMAVRLLKKFAEEFSMSLLVCMGMDGTSIRETFAFRLTLPTCAIEVKVAILELVAVCLEKQPGLTEALFNIMHQAERKRIFPRPADEFLTEGCSQFLDSYLERMYKEDDIVCDKLYDSTMTVLRAMWYHRNEILVNFFRKREKFWSHLFAPLFKPLVAGAKGYSQLLDVITLELYKSPLLENNFSKSLRELLDKSKDHWKKLAMYVLDVSANGEGENNREQHTGQNRLIEPLYEINLESWYHFIVMLTDDRTAKNYPINVTQAHLLTQLALDSLLKRVKESISDVSSGKIPMLLASLSLRCITSWKQMCVGDSRIFKTRLSQLTQEIAQTYRGFGKALRQTMISLLLGCVQLVKSTLAEDSASLEYLLAHSCTIAICELEELKEAALQLERRKQQFSVDLKTDEKGTQKKADCAQSAEALRGMRESLPATLAISMVTQLLRSYVERNVNFKHHLRASCVQLRQMIPELMVCVGYTLQKYPYLKFSAAAMSLLGVISRSPYCPYPINNNDITKLWLGLIPPADIANSMLDSLYDDSANGQWRCQDWWPLYTLGLEFLVGLVNSETRMMFVNHVVVFLNSHEHQLMVVSTLLRHTADLLAADLIQSLVALIHAIATQTYVWNAIEPSVRDTLIKCMYLAYDSTVNLLLRPRILKFIIDGISVESAEELESCDNRLPSGELKLLVNKLIVINTTCALSFVHFSPKLNTLVDTIYTQDYWYTPMAEMNFGPPQMSMSSGPQLTYGTIISSTQLFTQALHSRSQPVVTSLPASSTSQPGGREDKTDSAKKEWERAAPENLRRMHTSKDLRRIIHAASGSSTSRTSSNIAGEFLGYVSGLDVTVPLLSSPRLLRRPYDPLICENTILSRATALATGRHVTKSSGSGAAGVTPGNGNGPIVVRNHRFSDPWFESMDENNTRLALEINLVLILSQALEGVKNPRLALRDRQLIARETDTELGVFFEFLEHRGTPDIWQVKGSLIDADTRSSRTIQDTSDPTQTNLLARLQKESTIDKAPVCLADHESFSMPTYRTETQEKRLDDSVLTTGVFKTNVSSVQFLPLMGKLLKTVVESLDSAQFR